MKPQTILTLTLALLTASCTNPVEEQIRDIQNDIQNEQFQTAIQKLQNAKHKTSSEHTNILDYNQAVVQILAGNCSQAQEITEKLLKTLENQSSEQEKYKNSTRHYEESKLKARLHHALALSILCPSQTLHTPTDQDYETALTHLYHAANLGLPIQDSISKVLTQWIKPCQTFIPEKLKQAESPHKAIPISKSREENVIICPNGIWFKFQARQNEIVNAQMILKPLARKIWPDESSQLPFIQINADLFAASQTKVNFSSPVFHYELPLPSQVPPQADYESIQLSTPDVHIAKTDQYLLHIYTKNNGEAQLIVNFEKSLDCGAIDDTHTYDENLTQTPVTLIETHPIEHLTLCPERPDAFKIQLEPRQTALITINTQSPDITHPNYIRYQLKDKTGANLKNLAELHPNQAPNPLKISDFKGAEPPAALFAGKYAPTPTAGLRPATPQIPQPQDLNQNLHYTTFIPIAHEDSNAQNSVFQTLILIHNPKSTPENIELTLNIDTPHTPMPYDIGIVTSYECSDDMQPPIQFVNLKNIEQTKQHFETPIWVCPNTTLRLQPLLPENTNLIRAQTHSHLISHDHIGQTDVQFASYLHDSNGARDFLIENAKLDDNPWTPAVHVISQMLQKPISAQSQFHTTLNAHVSGFQLIHIQLNDDSSDDSSDSQKENKQNQKDQNQKDQKDQDNKQNTPNKSPEKPSETPAAPKGPGTDTKGDESSPDENAKGNKASKLDLRQQEKNNIDALMDAMENGNFYVPLSGQEKITPTDKPW